MSRATPQILEVTARLIAYELNASKPSEAEALVAFRVCEKLQPHLATLMGKGGVRAIFSRALAVAQAENGWLRGVLVSADGALNLAGKTEAPGDAEGSREGGVLLVAQLLGLLAAFIGETLTLRVVLEVWPKLNLNNLKTKGDRP